MSYFYFHGYTLRTAVRDLGTYAIANEWTKADPDHCDTTEAGFWFDQQHGESYVLEDANGIVFFFKMQRQKAGEIELHIQFPPAADNPHDEADRRERVMRGLNLGLEWIERILAMRDVSTLSFTSKSPTLIRFCEKRLGFTVEGKNGGRRLVKRIGTVEGSKVTQAAK